MAVFTLEDAQGGVEVIVFPEAYQRARQPDRDRHAGPRARQARARRRVGADSGVGDRAARQRARAAGARGGDPLSGCPPTAACSRRSARSSRATAATARVVRNRDAGGAAAAAARARRRVSSQIRVRPSPALIAEVEQIVGHGLGVGCDERLTGDAMPETLEFEEPIAVAAEGDRGARRCCRAPTRAIARSRRCSAASSRCAPSSTGR